MASFTMVAGDTRVIEVSVVENGKPVDITNATIRWAMARTVSDTPLVEKSEADGIVIQNGVDGIFSVIIEPADTATLRGTFYFEVEVNDQGIISTVLTGTMQINPSLIT